GALKPGHFLARVEGALPPQKRGEGSLPPPRRRRGRVGAGVARSPRGRGHPTLPEFAIEPPERVPKNGVAVRLVPQLVRPTVVHDEALRPARPGVSRARRGDICD